MNFFNTQQKIAFARLAHRFVKLWRRARGKPLCAEFERGALRWMLDLDEGIDFSIFLLGAFEPDTVRCYESRLQHGDVALDVGANIGAHTLPLARAVGPGGRVLAFEPTAYACAKLRANLALNPELIPRVTLRQLLLSDTPGAAIRQMICSGWPLIHEEGLHPKHLGKAHSTDGAGSSTLDEAVKADGIGKVAFVKLDVDGDELSVLRGATATLTASRPPILIELCPHVCHEHGYPLSALTGYLTALGYGFESLDGHQLPGEPAALEKLVPAGGSMNVMAIPR